MIYQSCQNKNVDIPAFVGYNEIKGGVLMLTIPDLKRKPDIIDEGNKIVVAFFCRYLI